MTEIQIKLYRHIPDCQVVMHENIRYAEISTISDWFHSHPIHITSAATTQIYVTYKLWNSEEFATSILQAANDRHWNGKKPIKL